MQSTILRTLASATSDINTLSLLPHSHLDHTVLLVALDQSLQIVVFDEVCQTELLVEF